MRRPIQRNRVMSEINITPLTDVMMVLLIIFMVTTPLIMKASIDINLPKAHVKQSVEAPPIQITLTKNGEIFLNGTLRTQLELAMDLRDALQKTQDLTVMVSADEEVPYGKAVQILDLARQTGATKLFLAAEPLPVRPLSEEILKR